MVVMLYAVLGSVLVCGIALVALHGWQGAFETPVYYILSAAIPLLLTPPCIIYFTRLTHQLTQANDAYRTLAEEYRRTAELDLLTRVYNRRGLFARHAVVPAGAVVALADIDGFKAVNDTRGHLTGDEALVAVADALSRLVGPDGTVARSGGDEFVLVYTPSLPFADRRLQVAVTDDLTVTVSLGGVTADAEIPLDVALVDADAAMYRTKVAGPRASIA